MVKTRTQLAKPGEDVESLAKQAYSILRDRIVSLDLPPGALLSETTLGDSMGISRTPIREALKQLERDYLIAIMPRRGIIVTEIDLHDQLKLLDIRRGIEATLFARAAERATAAQLKQFEALATKMQRSLVESDMHLHYAVDKVFDELIDDVADNRFLTDTLRPVHSLVRRFWYRHNGTEAVRGAIDRHMVVTHAVAAGDPAKVRAATTALFDYNEAFIRKLLR